MPCSTFCLARSCIFTGLFLLSTFLNKLTTSGSSNNNTNTQEDNKGIQPILVDDICSFVFNGNILTKEEINNLLNDRENVSLDTNKIIKFLRNYKHQELTAGDFFKVLENFYITYNRAFNIIFLFKHYVFIIRDVYGTRPLYYINNTHTITIGSETVCSSDNFNQNIYRNVEPGEIILINTRNLAIQKKRVRTPSFKAHCLFESLYFMNKHSINLDTNTPIYYYRIALGNNLAKQEIEYEAKFNLDISTMYSNNHEKIVIGIPESGYESGRGYADYRKYPFTNKAIIKTKQIRSFIGKTDAERKSILSQKFIFNDIYIKDKVVFLVDDSIVRGHTMKYLVEKCFSLGAVEVHVRIASPPIRNVCPYGVDLKSKNEMIANKYRGNDGIQSYIGATTLVYLSLENMEDLFKLEHYCMGCINGNYNESCYSTLKW